MELLRSTWNQPVYKRTGRKIRRMLHGLKGNTAIVNPKSRLFFEFSQHNSLFAYSTTIADYSKFISSLQPVIGQKNKTFFSVLTG